MQSADRSVRVDAGGSRRRSAANLHGADRMVDTVLDILDEADSHAFKVMG